VFTQRTAERNSGYTALLLLSLWAAATLSWWALAFPPLQESPPEWLSRLQAVCFGSDLDGRPKLYGWGALIAGPLAFWAAILVGWGKDLRDGLRPILRTRIGRLWIAGVIGLLLAQLGWAGWLTLGRTAPGYGETTADGNLSNEPFPPDYPRLNLPLPGFTLVDRSGQRRTEGDIRGRLTLVTFAYGHCTTVCPATVASVQTAAQRLSDVRPLVVIITLDAWRDTPSALRAIAVKWGLDADTWLLSGRVAEVNRVLDAFNVARARNTQTGDVDHVALTYIVDMSGRIAFAVNAPGPAWIVAAARRAMSAPAVRVTSG
jgi:cytochrome oxidase Cu insertion factor (SCO1/SenC/PrrC family)